MALPRDLEFGAALAVLGVVMLTIAPGAALWLGVLLVLAALTYTQQQGNFLGDLETMFGVIRK